MQYIVILIQIVPILLRLITMAEKLFADQPQSGAEKKTFVTEIIKSIVEGMVALSTGGQKDTWEYIRGNVSELIDLICGVLFPHE